MPFTVLSLQNVVGAPPTRVPINTTTFISYLIPPLIFYYIAAVLTLTTNTRAVRVVLWPVLALLAFRAAISVDMSQGMPGRKCFNIDLMLSMLNIAVHTLSWTLAKKPLVRHLRPANGPPSTLMDAFDLVANVRGYGWEWSRGLRVPCSNVRRNRAASTFYALLSAFAHGWIVRALKPAFQALTAGIGSNPQRPTIFDETVPFSMRYLRATSISILFAFTIYASLRMIYDFSSLFGMLLFGQHPAQWPPAFDSPWRATSISEFWNRRWHQWLREVLLVCAYPFSVAFGPTGKVIGAFVSSAILHHLMMTLLDGQAEMWRMLVGFGMMAPGILAERTFRRLTGRKVGGVIGWFWTMTWLLLWGNIIVDGFARAGLFTCLNAGDNQLPLQALIKSVVDFGARYISFNTEQ